MVEIIINNQGQLCAVVYQHNGRFIAAEPRSSMGFDHVEGAFSWLGSVCKGGPFTPEDNTYKMIPDPVKTEVERQFNEYQQTLQQYGIIH